MLFLINNPWLLLIGLFVVVFTTFMVRKITREISFNRKLMKKKQAMRLSIPASGGFKTRIGILTSTALAPILVIALVFSIGSATPLSPSGELHDIKNQRDVLDIYNAFQERMQTYQVFTGWRNDDVDVALEGEMPVPDANDDGDQGSDDYSETNNQVQGVDEMDNVVTDGKYIYSMKYNQVHITLAFTQSLGASALSHYMTIDYIDDETDCPSGMYVTGLYVDEDYLVVVGSQYEYQCDSSDGDELGYDELYYDYWYGYNNNVVVYVYDKQDDFALLSEYEVSGNLIGTRKIEDNLYIVTSTYIPFYQDHVNVDSYLPYTDVNGEVTTATYTDIVYVEGTSPNSFTSFYALDLDNEAVDMEVILGDNGYNLYVSPNNMYLVGNLYYFAPLTEFIDLEDPVAETKTAIQKISINDADLEYVTTGTVLGTTLNQFSMDEYNGNLRIATTTGWWGQDINNRVFILDEDLNEISRIEHLGKPGETIRSVRFTADYGYVVTFEQTDPFYVLDLSDVDDPVVEGELEIPGFSTYLQPLGNDYMLGIGFGDSEGGINGLKISIYDIRDKSNPTVFDEITFDYDDFGWNWSSATYNHKDLLVSLSKGVIALPFSSWNWNQLTGYHYNSGILVYHFDDNVGLEYSGFITHETNAEEDLYVYKIKFIDNYFYTVSDKYIQSCTIGNPDVMLGSVTLP